MPDPSKLSTASGQLGPVCAVTGKALTFGEAIVLDGEYLCIEAYVEKTGAAPSTDGKEVKRVIKRRRRKKKGKIYFSKDTELAIIEYNKSEDVAERNRIYNAEISYAFDKLAENILNTFKFSYFQCSHEEVQQEVVSNLVSNIHKYKPDNGKAFSYFK